MDYFINELCYVKKPLKLKPVIDVDTFSKDSGMQKIRILVDKSYITGLLDEVHRQIINIKRITLSPLYVIMNQKTYEQMLIYTYNLTKDLQPKTLFGLTPIISTSFEDYEVEVQCSAFDEFIYREELSQSRYAVKDD